MATDATGDVFATTQYASVVEVTPGGGFGTIATFPAGIAALVAPVPEPAPAGLVATIAATAFGRRRRSRA